MMQIYNNNGWKLTGMGYFLYRYMMTLTSGSNIQVANVITYQKLLTPAPLGLSCSSSERCWTLFSKSLSLCSNSAETRVFAWTLNTSPDSLQNETVNLRDPTHPFFFFFFFCFFHSQVKLFIVWISYHQMSLMALDLASH